MARSSAGIIATLAALLGLAALMNAKSSTDGRQPSPVPNPPYYPPIEVPGIGGSHAPIYPAGTILLDVGNLDNMLRVVMWHASSQQYELVYQSGSLAGAQIYLPWTTVENRDRYQLVGAPPGE